MADDFWDPGLPVPAGAVNPNGYEGALFATNRWETVIIGGNQLPGLCEVDAKPKKRHDKRGAAGEDGTSTTMHGYEGAEVTVSVRIWTPQQWTEFKRVRALFWPAFGKGNSPSFDIDHPDLANLGIKSVKVVEVGTGRPGKAKGEKVFPIKCVEFTKRKKGKVVTQTDQASLVKERRPPPTFPTPALRGVNYNPSNAPQGLPSQDPKFAGPR